MAKMASEEVYRALEDVRDAARTVLTLPTLSAELVNALHVLVARAGKAASTVLLALPRDELRKVNTRRKPRTRARKAPRRKRRSSN
jgi:hypothetical protein